MKKLLLFGILLLSLCSFSKEYKQGEFQISYSNKSYFPVYDGIVLEGTNTFSLELLSDKLTKYWASNACGLSEYSAISKIETTYEKYKLKEAKCYGFDNKVLTRTEKKKKWAL